MRTTVTIDDDIARELKELQHKNKQGFKETVNDVLRRGLRAAKAPAKDPPFVVRTFDGGGFAPGIDPTKLNQFLDELEVEDFLEKFGGR